MGNNYFKGGVVFLTIVTLVLSGGIFAPEKAEAGRGILEKSLFKPGEQGQEIEIKQEPIVPVFQEQAQQEQEQPKKCKWYQKCTLKKIVNALKPSNIIRTVVETAKAVIRGVEEVAYNAVEFIKKPSLKTAGRLVNSVVNVSTGVAQVGFGTLFGSRGVVNEGKCRIGQSTASPAKLELGPITGSGSNIGLGGSFASTNCPNVFTNPIPPTSVPLGGGDGGSGSSAPQWEEISVEIDESVPPSVDLRVNGVDSLGSPMEAPASFTLSWTSSNAVSCAASDAWSGEKGISGSESWNGVGRGTFTYTLTCSHSGGLSASDSVSVRVVQVPRCSFSANPARIVRPQESTLSWSCQYADSCSIDNGIGSANNVSGSKQVSPVANTTYALTCQGLDGSRSFSTMVSVFVSGLKEVLPR